MKRSSPSQQPTPRLRQCRSSLSNTLSQTAGQVLFQHCGKGSDPVMSERTAERQKTQITIDSAGKNVFACSS